MRNFSIPYIAATLAMVALIGCEQGSKSTQAVSQTKAGIAWETNFQDALGKAKPSGKMVMVDFYADW